MTLVTGNFAEGFRFPHLPEDGATEEIFEKAINGKNGRKRCCHVVRVLIQRARILPHKEQECIQSLIKTAQECGTKNIIDALTCFGIKHPKTKNLCIKFISEVAFAS